jgi:hypothetical protein
VAADEVRAVLEATIRAIRAERQMRWTTVAHNKAWPNEVERGKYLGMALAEGVVDDLYRNAELVIEELERRNTSGR